MYISVLFSEKARFSEENNKFRFGKRIKNEIGYGETFRALFERNERAEDFIFAFTFTFLTSKWSEVSKKRAPVYPSNKQDRKVRTKNSRESLIPFH